MKRTVDEQHLISRALAVAQARGIHTSARTFRGVMRAIRRAALEDALRGRVRAREPVWMRARARQSMRYPFAKLVSGFDQGRAVVRIIDPHEPLRAAISAALGHDVIARIMTVPHRYQWKAYQSAASAKRMGGIVAIKYGRFCMAHRSYGHGGEPLAPDGSEWVKRKEIMQAIRLPKGWRWAVDDNGPYVRGHNGERYHPTPGEMAPAIEKQNWTSVIERATK